MKILVLDDQMLVADLISDYLKEDPRTSEIFSKYDANGVSDFIKINSIDLVFLDLYMPNLIGFEILEELRKEFDDLKVVILSSHFQAKYIKKALNLKANGFLSKSINKSEIQKTLDSIEQNKVYLCPECYEELNLNSIKEDNPKISLKALITERELEVLKLIADGLSSNLIGEKLFISKDTVETHKKNLYEKFGVKKVTLLVKMAVENEII